MNTQKYSKPYSSAFVIGVGFVLAAEGGYVNDPADSGGETHFGISKRSYPDLDIKSLTIDQAEAIYYDDYWKPCRCDEMPAALACLVFDTAVNMGATPAKRLLQMTLGVTADGVIGPKTLAACFRQPLSAAIPDFLSYRARRYLRIVTESGESRFYRGWLKRTYELQQHLYEERLL